MGRLLMALAEHCPEVEVALEHSSSLDILTGFRNGSLGAGFYNEAGEPDAALTTFEVARFGIYLAAPPGIAAASHPRIGKRSRTCHGSALFPYPGSLDGGGARYRNRWVRTPRWQAEYGAGRPLFGFPGEPSEPPFELDPEGLKRGKARATSSPWSMARQPTPASC